MGIYINRGNGSFRSARRSDYVDKSALISFINGTINTENRFTCVSRARRFGKSMAARMLYAYYDKSSDSRELFEDLRVADPANAANQNPDTAFETHLNKYPTLYIDIKDFDGVKQTIENLLIGNEEQVPVLNYGNDRNALERVAMNCLPCSRTTATLPTTSTIKRCASPTRKCAPNCCKWSRPATAPN